MNKETKNTTDFINQKTGKNTGFLIPKNYFDELEDNFTSEITIRSLSKKEAFTTPSNYFNTIENTILTKLDITTSKETKVISLQKRILQFVPLSAAAAVLLFIGLNYFNTNNTNTFDDITYTEITSWYENGYGETYNTDLATFLESEDFEDDFLTSINDNNLENYLDNIDEATFINEIE